MSGLTLLESFDTAQSSGDVGPGSDWLDGHRTGYDEGLAAARAEQAHLRGEAAQALSDLRLTARDARNRVLEDLAPLFEAIADKVIPALAAATVVPRLAAMLSAAASGDTLHDMVLRAAPDDVAALQMVAAMLPGGGVSIMADPRLSTGQVLLDTGTGETCFDSACLIRDITDALAALAHPTPRRSLNA